MSRNDWESLIERFRPHDKRICNCGDAYYTLVDNAAYGANGWEPAWICEHGCSANKIHARDHVAKCVLPLIIKDGAKST